MTDVFDVVAEQTGLDLRDHKLTENVIGPAVGSRIGEIFGDVQKGIELSVNVLSKLASGAVMPTTALINLAVDAITGLVAWLTKRLAEAEAENIDRKLSARDEFVKANYREGAWAQIFDVIGPSPSELDTADNKGGDTAEEHLAQYRPQHIVWHAERVVKAPALRPTWPWNPDPVAPDRAIPADVPNRIAQGYPALTSILGGFRATHSGTVIAVSECLREPVPILVLTDDGLPKLMQGRYCFSAVRPAIPGMDEGDADKYWCDPPTGGFGVASMPGCGIPPGYEYMFSWGTYPFVGWNGIEMPLGPYGVSVCLGLLGLTPIHAAVDAREVAICYRYWLEASKVRQLPAATVGQHDPTYLALDEDGLPWSPALDRFWPRAPSTHMLTIRDVRHIEQCFRDFFRVRRAAMYMFEFTSPSFKAAAKESADLMLRDIARGKPPPRQGEWRHYDPLGDGWKPESSGITGPSDVQRPKDPLGPGGFKTPTKGSGGAALVGGLALLAGVGVAIAASRGGRRS